MNGKRKTKGKTSKSSPGVAKFNKKEMRFQYSLVVLMGILIFSAFLFLIVLNKSASYELKKNGYGSPVSNLSSVKAQGKATNCTFEDPSIDFMLTMPVQLGEWIYKAGYVKSLTNDTLTNRYVKIFVPVTNASQTNNFEERNQEVVMIRRMTSDEWEKIKAGCENGNQFYCESAGEKLAENDGTVYSYVAEKECHDNVKAKCDLAERIVQSFKLK